MKRLNLAQDENWGGHWAKLNNWMYPRAKPGDEKWSEG